MNRVEIVFKRVALIEAKVPELAKDDPEWVASQIAHAQWNATANPAINRAFFKDSNNK